MLLSLVPPVRSSVTCRQSSLIDTSNTLSMAAPPSFSLTSHLLFTYVTGQNDHAWKGYWLILFPKDYGDRSLVNFIPAVFLWPRLTPDTLKELNECAIEVLRGMNTSDDNSASCPSHNRLWAPRGQRPRFHYFISPNLTDCSAYSRQIIFYKWIHMLSGSLPQYPPFSWRYNFWASNTEHLEF